MNYAKALRFSPRLTGLVHFESAFSSLPPYANRVSTELASPKFQPLQDSPILYVPELYSKLYAAPGLTFNYAISDKLNLRASGHYMQSFHRNVVDDQGQLSDEYLLGSQNRTMVGSAGAYYRTTIGPIGLFVNYYEQASNPLRIFGHLGYMIFDRHPWQ
jgi:hypothetical protein